MQQTVFRKEGQLYIETIDNAWLEIRLCRWREEMRHPYPVSLVPEDAKQLLKENLQEWNHVSSSAPLMFVLRESPEEILALNLETDKWCSIGLLKKWKGRSKLDFAKVNVTLDSAVVRILADFFAELVA